MEHKPVSFPRAERSELMMAIRGGTLLLACSACSGVLFIEEPAPPAVPCTTSAACGIGAVCDTVSGICVPSSEGCSSTVPQGDCPLGRLCVNGGCLCADAALCNCRPSGCAANDSRWCDCTPPQGCTAAGACVDIVPGGGGNSCTPARPTGVCEYPEICIGGRCVPNSNPCSDVNPAGWCQPGLSCRNGRCLPTDELPCSVDDPDGLCASGLECDATLGQCVVVPCAPGAPGVCPVDQVCGPSGCERLPCSPLHLTGKCDSGDYCSKAGICIADGACAIDDDCGPNQFCGTTSVCLDYGDCIADEDCSIEQPTLFGQGFACDIAGACAERLTCDTSVDCLPTKFCSSQNNCLAYPACDGNPDCPTGTEPPQICSVVGECINDGTCREDGDCVDPATCSHDHTCIQPGECAVTEDCPPAHSCSAPNCVSSGATCTTNGLKYTDCLANEVSCCESALPGSCCSAGEICSTDLLCIPTGACITVADCPPGAFACVDWACVPSKPCSECLASEWCSVAQACIPTDRCAYDRDCALGERCNSVWRCEPKPACGLNELSVGSLLPPNILVVLDRSASMQMCGPGDTAQGCCGYCPTAVAPCGACADADPLTCADADYWGYPHSFTPLVFDPLTCVDGISDCNRGSDNTVTDTRWKMATDAVKAVIADHRGIANFGLSMLPHPTGTETCTIGCNWMSCNDTGNRDAGVIDVAVDATSVSEAAIIAALDATVPGGGTPTGPTLRAVVADLVAAGLSNAETQNAILLVTDGEAIADKAPTYPAQQRVCAPACTSLAKDGDETDVDCGGSCGACAIGQRCLTTDDCQGGVCRLNTCRDATCNNGASDPGETDVDCGGACGPCADGALCNIGADCGSAICTASRCQAATCSDLAKNGAETDVDCGGGCTAKCAVGRGCLVDADCTDGACQAGVCRIASCRNLAKDAATETDVDCGGLDCGPCDNGLTCALPADCLSGQCTGAPLSCSQSSCKNGVTDGDETDVDCGGSCAAKCGGGKTCAAGGDCLSGSCSVCDTTYPACPDDPNCPVCGTSADPHCADAACVSCRGAAGNAWFASQYACKVNHALDQLYASTPRVKTYVVAFNFPTASGALNCHALHGRTYQERCPGLTEANCEASASKCYYDTGALADLQAALRSIIQQVRGCSFELATLPPEPNRLYLYLESPGTAGVPVLRRIERYVSWNYDTAGSGTAGSITVFPGPDCDAIKNGDETPVLILGCYTGE